MRNFSFLSTKYIYFNFLFIIWFCCNPLQLKAQTYGCHVQRGFSEVLYYTPYGAGSPSEWRTTSSPPVSATGEQGGYRNDGTASYGCIRDIGNSCTVYQEYEVSPGPPQVTAMRIYKTGTYANIDPMNCPIDDFVPFALVGAAGIGVLVLRKREFMVIG